MTHHISLGQGIIYTVDVRADARTVTHDGTARRITCPPSTTLSELREVVRLFWCPGGDGVVVLPAPAFRLYPRLPEPVN